MRFLIRLLDKQAAGTTRYYSKFKICRHQGMDYHVKFTHKIKTIRKSNNFKSNKNVNIITGYFKVKFIVSNNFLV